MTPRDRFLDAIASSLDTGPLPDADAVQMRATYREMAERDLVAAERAGLRVVGTCEGCRYWTPFVAPRLGIGDCRQWGECDGEHAAVAPHDGCTRWEART